MAARGPAISLVFLVASCAALAAAPRDRTPPTTPKNLRVTAMTPYTVTLAWTPSTDNSGQFSYVICCSHTSSMTAPQNVSSFVYTTSLEAGRTFTLRISRWTPPGTTRSRADFVTFTLPRDTVAPTQPLVSITDVGATHVSLLWSSIEDGPNVWYTVFMNGNGVPSTGAGTLRRR